jgi:hypothetical protein
MVGAGLVVKVDGVMPLPSANDAAAANGGPCACQAHVQQSFTLQVLMSSHADYIVSQKRKIIEFVQIEWFLEWLSKHLSLPHFHSLSRKSRSKVGYHIALKPLQKRLHHLPLLLRRPHLLRLTRPLLDLVPLDLA